MALEQQGGHSSRGSLQATQAETLCRSQMQGEQTTRCPSLGTDPELELDPDGSSFPTLRLVVPCW